MQVLDHRSRLDHRRRACTTLGILNADLTAYNAERGLFILLRVKQNPALDQVLRAKLTRSNTLVTVLDDSLRGIRAELTNFRLVINPQAGRLKGKKTPYAVLPKKCAEEREVHHQDEVLLPGLRHAEADGHVHDLGHRQQVQEVVGPCA